MRKNPLNQGIIMENAAGIGTVTTKMVDARARELARINGRGSKPTEADYQQAKRFVNEPNEKPRILIIDNNSQFALQCAATSRPKRKISRMHGDRSTPRIACGPSFARKTHQNVHR